MKVNDWIFWTPVLAAVSGLCLLRGVVWRWFGVMLVGLWVQGVGWAADEKVKVGQDESAAVKPDEVTEGKQAGAGMEMVGKGDGVKGGGEEAEKEGDGRRGGDRRGESERRRGPGGGPPGFGPGGPGMPMGSGRGPMFEGGFEHLDEDQKARLREVLSQAWGRPQVSAARDRLMKANEELKRAIHEAVVEIDPEMAEVMKTLKGPSFAGPGGGGRLDGVKLPPAESADFPGAVVRRLEMELVTFSPPERRERVRLLHGVVMQHEEVAAALRDLEAGAGRERYALMEKLRAVYRRQVGEEMRKNRDGERGK